MKSVKEWAADWDDPLGDITVEGIVRAIQADALEAAAQCAEAYAMTGVPVAEAIRALLKDEGECLPAE